MIAYIQVRDNKWADFLAQDSDTLRSQCASCEKLRRNGQLASGYWNGTIGFTVVNAIGSEAELDAFYNYFPPTDTLGYWKWGFDGKVDFATEYAGQHDDLLFLHKDIITYDQNGNPTGTTPASFDDPNWANGWAGQTQNRFARSFDRSFDGSFD